MTYKKTTNITPKGYKELSESDRYDYDPVFAKYKRVRYKESCEECGHFTGYSYTERGIGKPIKYVLTDPITATSRRLFAPMMADMFFKESKLLNAIQKDHRSR